MTGPLPQRRQRDARLAWCGVLEVTIFEVTLETQWNAALPGQTLVAEVEA
jgi:hypothetical protein